MKHHCFFKDIICIYCIYIISYINSYSPFLKDIMKHHIAIPPNYHDEPAK